MIIRIDMKKLLLIQLDLLNTEVRIEDSQHLITWFKSSPDFTRLKLLVSNLILQINQNN